MGKSQTRRLREAANRFGRENWELWRSVREALSALAYQKKADAGLIAPTAIGPVPTGSALVKRYSSSLTYQQNELTYGRSLK